jgi:hypothetical protein
LRLDIFSFFLLLLLLLCSLFCAYYVFRSALSYLDRVDRGEK